MSGKWVLCKNSLNRFKSYAILANVQKSKRAVPPTDLNPQTEGRLFANINLKTSLILSFPIKRKFIRVGAPKKRSLHCLQFKIFLSIRETVDGAIAFLTTLGRIS